MGEELGTPDWWTIGYGRRYEVYLNGEVGKLAVWDLKTGERRVIKLFKAPKPDYEG